MNLHVRWLGFAKTIQIAKAQEIWSLINDSYSNSPEQYHTLSHIQDCLQLLDSHRDLASSLEAVELALWFHDAVYDPKATDNEEASAGLLSLHIQGGLAERAARLILLTRHTEPPTTPDGKLIVDIDLSILGQSTDRFDLYEMQIRNEYAWVPEDTFRSKRAQVLRQFISRDSIYSTARFKNLFEDRARDNIARSLSRL